jgi:sec-independent protein translocase protein TatB
MFDIGWSELLVIGCLALIVVGPKELPRMLRTLGRYTAQARGMAREFQRSMEDAAREADLGDMKEMREVASHLRDIRSFPNQAMKMAARPAAPAAATPAKAAPTPATPTADAAPQAPSPSAAAPDASSPQQG